MTRESGKINLLLDSFQTDHTSDFHERWGGWYVTGEVGSMRHMGNAFLENDHLVPDGGGRRNDLTEDFETSSWPIPHSDVVALMVLEHQTGTHNELTRAGYDVRRARHKGLEGKALAAAIDAAAERVVDTLLFVGEPRLPGPVTGATAFADHFSRRGPFDDQGRSLRQFDLETRLFRFPCSYLIYSEVFDALDDDLKSRIYGMLAAALQRPGQRYDHLTRKDRKAIIEILRSTKQDLPNDWIVGDAE